MILTQMILPTVMVLVIVWLIFPILNWQSNRVRSIIGLVVLGLSFNYLIYRFTATLPILAFTFQALWPWLFFLVEALAILSSLISFLYMSKTRNNTPMADQYEKELRSKNSDDLPSVDILIPTYNENENILFKTIAAAKNINWPNKKVYVCDDGKRDWLIDLCKRLGVNYIRRDNNEHAKAGNINNALEQTSGDFVLLVDADFVIKRNMLYRTMGFFNDEKISIVQTPQHFFNPDPIQNNMSLSKTFPNEQRFFFDTFLPSRDAWDAAFCCGTGVVIRRETLDLVGGMPTECITEDALLTYVFMEKGYITRYLNEELAVGLAPEGVHEYSLQRSRWCLGTLQMALLKSGPFGRNKLSIFQRIHVIDSILYWGISFTFKMMGLLAPVLFWWFGVWTILTPVSEFAFYFFPMYIWTMASLYKISNGKILPIFSDIQHSIMILSNTKTIFNFIKNPFGKSFNVTPKGYKRNTTSIYWPVAKPFMILIAVLIFGMLFNVASSFAIISLEANNLINVFWTVYNLLILILGLVVLFDRPRHRDEERMTLIHDKHLSSVYFSDLKKSVINIKDISVGGALINSEHGIFKLGDKGRINIINYGEMDFKIVRIDGNNYGIKFNLTDLEREKLVVTLFHEAKLDLAIDAKPKQAYASMFHSFFTGKI